MPQFIAIRVGYSESDTSSGRARATPARYMCWRLSSIRTFLDKRPELRVALQGLVNRDLAGKVERLAERGVTAT
jgi:hypothetical protein